MQTLRMIFHFLSWCIKKFFGLFSGLTFSLRLHAAKQRDEIRKSFVMSLLGLVISCIICLFIAMFIGEVFLGGPVTDDAISAAKFGMGFNVGVYLYHCVRVLYTMFLEDYDHVFTILKDDN